MRGKILDFSIQENTGYISGDDGKRYTFLGKEWREVSVPKKGEVVDFEMDESGKALKVYIIAQQGIVSNNEDVGEITQVYIKQLEIEKNYGMIAWFKKCMRNYVNFSGRARRSEFWYFVLMTFFIQVIPTFIIGFISYYIVNNQYKNYYYDVYNYYDLLHSETSLLISILIAGGYSLICTCIFIIPSFAVTVHRLHDIGQSGWWSLLIVITYITPLLIRVGGPAFAFIAFVAIFILFIIWGCTDTKKQENQWGLPAK